MDASGFSGLFPFLFGGTFIEGDECQNYFEKRAGDFPSFSEGLSLRGFVGCTG